jgi:hypothetical protein
METEKIRIVDGRNRGKFFVDDEYVDSFSEVLGWKANLAYMALCRYAGDRQQCFPSLTTMARKMGLKKADTIAEGIKELVGANIIAVENTQDGGKRYTSNVYTLLDKSVWKLPSETRVKTAEKSLKTGTRNTGTVAKKISSDRTRNTGSKETVNHGVLEVSLLTNVNNEQPDAAGSTESVKKPDPVNSLMAVFYQINPTLNFGNRTLRAAGNRLIARFGEEKALAYARSATAAHGQPYAPVITDPADLERKIAKLEAFYKNRLAQAAEQSSHVYVSKL